MKILLLLLITTILFADIKSTLLHLYEQKKYKQCCLQASQSLPHYQKDEQYLSLLGFSCLKSGYLDRLALPIAHLKSTPEARANAAYFSLILMQKKLLLHSMVDKVALKNIQFPTTDTLLSTLFTLYLENGDFLHDSYTFKDKKNKDIIYKLYLLKESHITKMVLELHRKNKIEKKYIYW